MRDSPARASIIKYNRIKQNICLVLKMLYQLLCHVALISIKLMKRNLLEWLRQGKTQHDLCDKLNLRTASGVPRVLITNRIFAGYS
jgi:hypothetical protein